MERRGYNFIVLSLVSIAYAVFTSILISSIIENGISENEFRDVMTQGVLLGILIIIAILYVVEAILSFISFKTLRKFYVNLAIITLVVILVLILAIGWYPTLVYNLLLLLLLFNQKRKMNLLD